MSAVTVVKGFSTLNRWQMYTSVILSPSQYASGIGSYFPANLVFLACNYYAQVKWYEAVQSGELHALCMIFPHFNLVFSASYFGGITSGARIIGYPLGLGTAGVIILNTVSSWIAWATVQPEGYGDFEFFFFGWQTLGPGWHKFIAVWQVFDSIIACSFALKSIDIAFQVSNVDRATARKLNPWWGKYVTIPLFSPIVLVGIFPLILWTEMIIIRNNIESETDWVQVYLFIGQVGALLMPSLSALICWLSCGRFFSESPDAFEWPTPSSTKVYLSDIFRDLKDRTRKLRDRIQNPRGRSANGAGSVELGDMDV